MFLVSKETFTEETSARRGHYSFSFNIDDTKLCLLLEHLLHFVPSTFLHRGVNSKFNVA